MSTERGIHGDLSKLYDVFVDWPGRLSREIPGIESHLRAVGARRVLDVGCGTGRHVHALLERGFDAHGADVSGDMLAQAAELAGGPARFHAWCLGDPPPAGLRALAPFDALICMGNAWPHLSGERQARDAARAFLELLRPGGLLLIGMKALAAREPTGNPYMPLMRRRHGDETLWFVRFVDFHAPSADAPRSADLHMAVLAGESGPAGARALLHSASRVRVWSAAELTNWATARGFAEVRVSARLDDPSAPPQSEDVFLSARAP